MYINPKLDVWHDMDVFLHTELEPSYESYCNQGDTIVFPTKYDFGR